MHFVTGKPVGPSPVRSKGFTKSGRAIVSGLEPASTRQRLVELRWHPEAIGPAALAGPGDPVVKAPVLGTIAKVYTRVEFYANQGGPGDREMLAIWTEDGDIVELQASVPDLAGMEERLGWLTKVDSQTWLEAMPAKVVKAADFEGTVKDLLKGIPLPKTFAVSRVPDEGLTTSRDNVTSTVTGTVACLWLRQWGEARRDGDEAAAAEAERAMASSAAGRPSAMRRKARPIPPRRSPKSRQRCRAATGSTTATTAISSPTPKASAAPASGCHCCRKSRSANAKTASRRPPIEEAAGPPAYRLTRRTRRVAVIGAPPFAGV